MGILEDIQNMRQEGLGEEEIISRLQEQGNSYRQISEAMAQSRIKEAVEDPLQEPMNDISSEGYSPPAHPMGGGMPGMQQSIMEAPQEEAQAPAQQEYFPSQQSYGEQSSMQQGYPAQEYDYNASAGGISSDTIMEISEQIVSEKLTDVRKKMEKMAAFKAELEAKTEGIEERLKRIEKIIDTLQASVLRKVGDYVTNVEDLKHEMIETQKTFAKVLGSKHHNPKEHHKEHHKK